MYTVANGDVAPGILNLDHTSHLGCFTPGQEPPAPMSGRLGRPEMGSGLSGRLGRPQMGSGLSGMLGRPEMGSGLSGWLGRPQMGSGLSGRLGGPQMGSRLFGEELRLSTVSRIEPQTLTHTSLSSVTVVTELLWVYKHKCSV